MNVALEGDENPERTCAGWQTLCVSDLKGGSDALRLFTEGDDLHDA